MAKEKTDRPAPTLALLSCETIGDLDNGFARTVIDEALRRAAHDIEQRGEDDKPRKVLITIEMKKLDANAVAILFSAEAKLPPFKLNPTVALSSPAVGGGCTLHFRADNGARPDQPTIPFPPEERNRE